MSNKLFIVPIEQLDSRYTKQWYDFLPAQLEKHGLEVVTIEGDEIPPEPTPGAFLDFAATNVYKSSQLVRIAQLIREGKVKNGDYFLYTDAWNPTVIQLKYMTELLGIKVKIGGLWHAGSYDQQDFLGRIIGNAHWVRRAEVSMFNCYNHNFFATEFHLDMFALELFDKPGFILKENNSSVRVVGWPMEYLVDVLAPYTDTKKKQKIIFPHRIAPEKQLDIFKDLAESLPEYEWFVAQEHALTKHEYHTYLAESKIAFSANLQETLGISMYEAAVVGTVPMVPDRLSYREMWTDIGTYTSEWTTDWDSYQTHKELLIGHIKFLMGDTTDIVTKTKSSAVSVGLKFFNGEKLYQIITDQQS